MTPGVFITFDVECSMGGAWGRPDLRPVPPERAMLGRYGRQELGLPLICSILERFGHRASFFFEAFTPEQGYPAESAAICRDLAARGQDVQLHVHPNHKHYGLHLAGEEHPRTDQIADLDADAQRVLLAEGAERIAAWTGRRPVAFRAGNMGASETTLAQLAAVGIGIDSSYTFPYVGGQCRFADRELYNGSKWYGEVLELGLSGFRKVRLPGLHPAKPLDLVGISFQECRDAIRRICDAGADAVVILHSFSLFKVRNVQYDGGRPNRIVTRRFRRLCRWLADHRERYPTRTFSELAEAVAAGQYQARAVPPCRLGGPRAAARALTRKAVQAVNRLHWV